MTFGCCLLQVVLSSGGTSRIVELLMLHFFCYGLAVLSGRLGCSWPCSLFSFWQTDACTPARTHSDNPVLIVRLVSTMRCIVSQHTEEKKTLYICGETQLEVKTPWSQFQLGRISRKEVQPPKPGGCTSGYSAKICVTWLFSMFIQFCMMLLIMTVFINFCL